MIAGITAIQPFSSPVVHKTNRVEMPMSVRNPFVVSKTPEIGGVWLDDEPVADDN